MDKIIKFYLNEGSKIISPAHIYKRDIMMRGMINNIV